MHHFVLTGGFARTLAQYPRTECCEHWTFGAFRQKTQTMPQVHRDDLAQGDSAPVPQLILDKQLRYQANAQAAEDCPDDR